MTRWVLALHLIKGKRLSWSSEDDKKRFQVAAYLHRQFEYRIDPKDCVRLKTTIGKSVVKNFSDGEINVEIDESVRGMDVFAIQSICDPVNNNLMELLILIDALKRASARRITAVLPYYGYARQDRKVSPRAPISAKLVADLITTAGASRILAVDLHAGQIQGFFNIPVDHLFAAPIILDYLKKIEE